MRKLALLLFVLLVVQSFGVYGAYQAQRVVYRCKIEVGPLCYLWEPSAIGKIVGSDPAAELEATLERSRDTWDEQVAKRLDRIDTKDVGKALEKAGKALGEGLEKLGEGAAEVLEKAKE